MARNENYPPELERRAGWLLLHWAGIDADDADALDGFMDAVGDSSVPEAAGIVGGACIDANRRAMFPDD